MYKATLAMCGAVLLWASSGSASKLALEHLSVAEGATFRIVGAAVVLWFIGVIVLRRNFRLNGPRPLIMGILEPAMVTFFIMAGVAQTSAVNAAVVWGIMPVTQPLMARIFLKEPIQTSVVFGATLAVAGTILLFVTKQQDGTGTLTGDLLLLCAVASASINQMLARTVAKRDQNPLVTTSYQLLAASLVALIFLALNLPAGGIYTDVPTSLTPIMALLIVTTAGPFFLYNFAMQAMPIGRVSLFAPLSGPIGAVIATVVFSEPLHAVVILALAMSLSGALAPALAGRWRALW
jgi:drug/metabolite transporter (DMT)-like permease